MAVVIIFIFVFGMVRILLDITSRAIVIARVWGCSFWMFGALWDTGRFPSICVAYPMGSGKRRRGCKPDHNQMEER
jgi:hypothetical protein